jgi:hypothetical protein
MNNPHPTPHPSLKGTQWSVLKKTVKQTKGRLVDNLRFARFKRVL